MDDYWKKILEKAKKKKDKKREFYVKVWNGKLKPKGAKA